MQFEQPGKFVWFELTGGTQQISNAGAGRHAPSIGRDSLVVHGGNDLHPPVRRAEGSDHSGERDRCGPESQWRPLKFQLIRIQLEDLRGGTGRLSGSPRHRRHGTAIIGPLDQNHVPVDRRLVAIVGVFVSIARREVQTARTIKKNVVLASA